jgi:hypothetical protein
MIKALLIEQENLSGNGAPRVLQYGRLIYVLRPIPNAYCILSINSHYKQYHCVQFSMKIVRPGEINILPKPHNHYERRILLTAL